MGNTNSTRKITVPNEDPTSVIKVSDAVVQRLKGKQEGKNGGEKEAQLRSNDFYWENRLNKLRETHRKINQHMEEQFESAVFDVEQSFQNAPKATEIVPCLDAKEVVMKCYLENPREALLCSKQVKEFEACVDLKRMNVIANKG